MRSPLAALRALWASRPQPEETEPVPRPDRSRIAVLEYELLGVDPEPGTPEAMAVAQATPVDRATCPHEDVIDVSQYGAPRPEGMCGRCGTSVVGDDDGSWRVV